MGARARLALPKGETGTEPPPWLCGLGCVVVAVWLGSPTMLWLLSFCCKSRSRLVGFCPGLSLFFFLLGGARQSATPKCMLSKCGPAMMALRQEERESLKWQRAA